ncbi:MAG: hypothetical protein HY540_08215 [Deltaproteobacteria bacterium]|nr:hypothetical protein [Deltaproteobacteria bacterium]
MRSQPLSVVAAMDAEIRPLIKKMTIDLVLHQRTCRILSGHIDKREVILVRSGIGARAMHDAIRLLFQYFNPAFVLHVGICGATDPQLLVGDMVLSRKIVDVQSEKSIGTDAALLQKSVELCQRSGLRYQEGDIAAIDYFLRDAHEKTFIGTRANAIAIDMESFAFAEAMAERKIPHLVARSVFDPLDMQAPDMTRCINADGNVNIFALLRWMVTRPQDVVQLPKMHYCMSKSSDALFQFAMGWMGDRLWEDGKR